VQFVDDVNRVTLSSVGTLGMEGKKNLDSARALGRRAAQAALDKGVKRVVVDRGGYKFHGRIKAVVDAATEAGLSIRSAGNEAAAAVENVENKEEK
jgi:large subunit ribosomal protein L18